MTVAINHEVYMQFCCPGASGKKISQRRPLTEQQKKVHNLAVMNWSAKRIAARLDMPIASVYDAIGKIRNNGWL